MLWLPLATENDWSTGGAALQFVSPGCEARTVTVPAPVIVRVLPEIVAGPESTLKLTAKPEEAVALRFKGASPKVLFAREPKVIVWLALATAKTLLTALLKPLALAVN